MNDPHATTIDAANNRLLARGELDAVDDFFTADYVAHGTDRDLRGRAGVRRYLGMLREAFPALEVEVEVLAACGDRISWQRTLRGVQDGPFMGFPATHGSVVWRDMVTSRFRDGFIAEEWVVTDLAEHLLLARKKA